MNGLSVFVLVLAFTPATIDRAVAGHNEGLTVLALSGQLQQDPQGAPRVYNGEVVSMDFQGADLRAVLRTFAEISGLNLVIDPGVDGTVDVALTDVHWDQALDVILRANQLGYVVDGTVVRIAPLRVLADEETQRRQRLDEQALSGDLVLLTRTLSYAKASVVGELVTPSILSARGQVQRRTQERTRSSSQTCRPAWTQPASCWTHWTARSRKSRSKHALSGPDGTLRGRLACSGRSPGAWRQTWGTRRRSRFRTAVA